MTSGSFSRMYVMLRPLAGSATGFARLENRGGRGRMELRASSLPTGSACLRVLLLSGDAQSGAMLDLGLLRPTVRGCASLRRDSLPLSFTSGKTAYHSLLICTDWPDPTLLLHGALDPEHVPPRWQLEEAVRHYLSVPPEAKPADAPVTADENAPAPADVDAPAAPADAHAIELAPTSTEASPCELHASLPPRCEVPDPLAFNCDAAPKDDLSVMRLPDVEWPSCFEELRAYFDALSPIAPFDAPGWRYVKVPIPARDPAPWCAVGVKLFRHRVMHVAYALPGQPGALPAGGLQGYRWLEGRNGQGYWVLFQHAPA